MKSLYDVNHRYTVEAQALDASVGQVLKPYFDKLVDAGYSPREISHVIHGVTNELEMEAVLNHRRLPLPPECSCEYIPGDTPECKVKHG